MCHDLTSSFFVCFSLKYQLSKGMNPLDFFVYPGGIQRRRIADFCDFVKVHSQNRSNLAKYAI